MGGSRAQDPEQRGVGEAGRASVWRHVSLTQSEELPKHMEQEVESMHLGQRIAGLRRAHGLTQRRLAEVAGVSNGYIALLELGRLPSPGKFRLDAIARALDLGTSDALLAAT